MTATFDATLPTARDRMRYALGDTNVAAPLEQDETYDANLARYGEDQATAIMAEALATRYAQLPTSLSSPEGSISWGERVKQWMAIANRYRQAGSGFGGDAGTITATRGEGDESEYVRGVVLSGVVGWTG